MKKILILSVALLTFAFMGLTRDAHATVVTGSITNLQEHTSFAFGDGIHDLHGKWHYLNPGIGSILGYQHASWPSDAYVDQVQAPIDLSTFDAEPPPSGWHDLFVNVVAGNYVSFKGLNGYYGLWRIDSMVSDSFGRTFLNGQWYFQDDGTSYFGTTVPIPGAVWLLGSGLAGLLAVRRRKD